MVFCGDPSRACGRCRERRLKCDRLPDGCTQCLRRSVQCSGYRNEIDLKFRDQSDETAKKVMRGNKLCAVGKGDAPKVAKFNKECAEGRNIHPSDLVNTQEQVPLDQLLAVKSGALCSQTILPSLLGLGTATPCATYLETYKGMEKQRVMHCIDYYIKFCGPNFVWRPEVITTGSLEHFSQTFFQTTLYEPVFLETILTICQADLDARHRSENRVSEAVLAHRSRALKLLRSKLVSTRSANSEVVLATVVGMMTYDMTVREWSSYRIHLKYLRQILRSDAAVESLGWQGWFVYVYEWGELIWATHEASTAQRWLPRSPKSLHPPKYTNRATSEDMQLLVTQLPLGFRTFAQSGHTSVQMLKVLVEVSKWAQRCLEAKTNSRTLGILNIEGMRLAAKSAKMFGSKHLRASDSLICIAMIAYITSRIEGPAGHSRGLEDLTVCIGIIEVDVLEGEHWIWVAMTIATANETFPSVLPHRWTLLDKLLHSQTAPRTWAEVLAVAQKFFWDYRLANRWRQCWATALQRHIIETR